MQRLKLVLFAVCISVIFLANVEARSCSIREKAELNRVITNIKVNYAENERKMESMENDNEQGGFTDGGSEPEITPEDGEEPVYEDQVQYYFDISLTNLTDQFYVTVSNDWELDENGQPEEKTYHYSDSRDGIITFPWTDLYEVTTFTFKIYASDKTNCSGELEKTLTLRVPRLNGNYKNPLCEGIEDYDLCQKYVTFDPFEDIDTFEQRVNEYKESISKKDDTKEETKDQNWWDKTKDFVSENKYYFIGGGIAILVVAGVAVAVIVKKQRSSEL